MRLENEVDRDPEPQMIRVSNPNELPSYEDSKPLQMTGVNDIRREISFQNNLFNGANHNLFPINLPNQIPKENAKTPTPRSALSASSFDEIDGDDD